MHVEGVPAITVAATASHSSSLTLGEALLSLQSTKCPSLDALDAIERHATHDPIETAKLIGTLDHHSMAHLLDDSRLRPHCVHGWAAECFLCDVLLSGVVGMMGVFGGGMEGEWKGKQWNCVKALNLFVGGKRSTQESKRARVEMVEEEEGSTQAWDDAIEGDNVPSWAVALLPLLPLLERCCIGAEMPTRLAVGAADVLLLLSTALHGRCWQTLLPALCETVARWRGDVVMRAAVAALLGNHLHARRSFWATCMPYFLSTPERSLGHLKRVQRSFESAHSAATWTTFALSAALLSPERRTKWLLQSALTSRGRLFDALSVVPHVAVALLCEMEPSPVRPHCARVLVSQMLSSSSPPEDIPSLVRLFFGTPNDGFVEDALQSRSTGAAVALVTYLGMHWSDNKVLQVMRVFGSNPSNRELLKPLVVGHVPLLVAASSADDTILDLWLALDPVGCWDALLDQPESVYSRLCARVQIESFAPLAERLVSKVLSRPADAALVKLASMCSAALSAHAPRVVLPRLLEVMQTQPALTQQLLDDPDSAKEVQKILFDRLAPLLLLRVLLKEAFASESQLIPLLMARIANLFEFDQVRRLAAETLAKMSPALSAPVTLASFARCLDSPDEEQSAQTMRAILYAWCGALALYKDQGTESLFSEGALLALRLLRRPPSSTEDSEAITKGAMEFLALCLRYAPSGLRARFLALLGGTIDEARLVAMVVAHLAQREKEAAAVLAGDAIDPLVKVAKQFPKHRVPFLMALFVLVYQAGRISDAQTVPLIELALNACVSSKDDPELRMAGLKLMGALFSVDGIFVRALPLLPSCAAALEDIARDTSHMPSCQLATQLRSTLESRD